MPLLLAPSPGDDDSGGAGAGDDRVGESCLSLSVAADDDDNGGGGGGGTGGACVGVDSAAAEDKESNEGDLDTGEEEVGDGGEVGWERGEVGEGALAALKAGTNDCVKDGDDVEDTDAVAWLLVLRAGGGALNKKSIDWSAASASSWKKLE